MSEGSSAARRVSVIQAVQSVVLVEGLEARRLYAASLPKIGQALEFMANEFAARPAAMQSRSVTRSQNYLLASKQPNAEIVATVKDAVLVKVVPNAKGARKLVTQLQGVGATVLSDPGLIMTAAVPISRLAKVNALSALQYADTASLRTTNAGKTDDYGVQAMNADKGQKQFAVDGTGVRVGILSDSYNALGGASAGVASGDLPAAGVTNVQEGPTNDPDISLGDEGRAMAEIVHDVAPGAAISFWSAFYDEAGFANGILNLAKPVSQGGQGAQVVVDDIGYSTEPYFQDGIIAQAVNTAAGQYGTSYFSAAGNSGRDSYESAFVSTGNLSLINGVGNGIYHDFDPGAAVNPYQPITLPAGETMVLEFQWDSPFYTASLNAGGTAGTANSISLYLTNANKTGVVATATTNRTGSDAYQELVYTNNTASTVTYYLVAKARYGAPPTYLKYMDFYGAATWGFNTNSGTSVGHPVASGGQSVGAAYYASTPAFGTSTAVKESYSSAGGTPIFFHSDGTRKTTAEYRNQPAIVAPDGAATTFFYSQETAGGAKDGQFHFYGTSAAAPHAAAVAALLLQAKPTLTNTQVYSLLQSTALDMGTAGFDFDTGFGLVQADKALAAAAGASISGRVYKDSNFNSTYDAGDTAIRGGTVFLDSNNNGSADSGAAVFGSAFSTAIPDATLALNGLSRVSNSITTTATGRVTGLTVSVNVSHNRTSDLGLTLITPGGTRIPLLTTLGGINASKGTGLNLTFNDAAAASVQSTSSTSILTGSYRPQTPLAAASNENASGTWQLEARDYKSGTTGTIINWSINLTYADPTATTDPNGNYAFTGLSPTAFYGTYRVVTPEQSGFTLASPAGGSFGLNLSLSGVAAGSDFRFVPNGTPATIASIILDNGSAQRSIVRGLTILLDGTIPQANIASGAFTLTQTSGPTISSYTATIAAVTTPTAGQTAITFNFSGSAITNGSLADGRYTLAIDGSKLINATGQATDAAGTGIAGSIKTYNFFRLSADADGNAAVNFNDFLALQNAFGTSSGDPTFNPGADNDGNGAINFNDFLTLQNQFGHTV